MFFLSATVTLQPVNGHFQLFSRAMIVIESTQRGGEMFKTRAFEEFITG
jgi:hypothetical protein